MNAKIHVVLVFPEDMSVLLAIAAGGVVADNLLGSLNDWDEGEVRVAGDVDGYCQAALDQFPRIAACQLAERHAEKRPGKGFLFIDGRAWFSRTALAAISARIYDGASSVRFVESNAVIFAAHREPMTLAVYVASQDAYQDLLADTRISSAKGLEDLLAAEVVANAGTVGCSELDPSYPAMGLRSLVDLAELERRLLLIRAVTAMKQGVLIRDPATTYIRGDLKCAPGVEIDINVIIEGSVVLGRDVTVGANSILRNCQIGDKTSINPFSLVEQSSVGNGSFIGPYGRIRPGSVIGNNVQIGNYVEIKNSRIGDDSRINHHTFIGDATLAQKVTIGAGTITCNHDGTGTNETIIERGAYIGSGCNLVAPLHIGQEAVVGAGSTIARDVPAAKLTLARERQITIDSWVGPNSRRQEE
jgi:bifunctional N-acetylglucosamine-1-phosphate-uridyltransferase/glucosamine-1-phosphate-acetyltransferase GlmU-like protein